MKNYHEELCHSIDPCLDHTPTSAARLEIANTSKKKEHLHKACNSETLAPTCKKIPIKIMDRTKPGVYDEIVRQR